MGIFDIFRLNKTESYKIARITLPDGTKLYPVSSKPRKEFCIRKCKECGNSVKHTCISERRKTIDVGGMELISQIWAIANHSYKDRKCRGSNRRYKKQFYK